MSVRRAFGCFREDVTWPGKATVALLFLGLPSVALVLFGFDSASIIENASGNGVLRNLLPLVVFPVVSLPVYGYWMRVIRRVATRDDVPLPPWSDVGDLLVDGLRYLGVQVVWTFLLLLAVACPLIALVTGVIAASGGGVPVWSPYEGSNWYATRLLTAIPVLLFGVFQAAALGRAAAEGSVGAGLDVGSVIRSVRDGFRPYLVASLILGGANLVTTLCFGSPPVVGLSEARAWVIGLAILSSVVSVYTGFVTAHLYGQAYWMAEAGDGSRHSPLPPRRSDRSTS